MQRHHKPPAMKPNIIYTGELSRDNLEVQDELDDSKYQVCWSNTMAKGRYGKPSSYKRVHALLMYWDESCGDLDTEGEVNELRDVFEQHFGYHTIVEPLAAAGEGKRPQTTLNAKVARFIDECDGPDTLLIVYYAGHGRPGGTYGQLQLLGETSLNGNKNGVEYQDRLVMWNKAERLLQDAGADILEIFDCCYAGTLGLTRGEPRLFEYLAATKDSDTTEIPGDRSFTMALIFALKALVKEKPEGRFTTVELLDKIRKKAPRFPKDQCPVLSDREKDIPAGRIMLYPLRKAGLDTPPSPKPPLSPGLGGKTVTFWMDFSDKPSLEDIEKLGEGINNIFQYNNLGVSRVRWGGMRHDVSARSVRVFQALLQRNRRASETRLQAMTDSDGSSDHRSSQDVSLLLTPTDTNPPSPQVQDFITDAALHADQERLAAISISSTMNLESKL